MSKTPETDVAWNCFKGCIEPLQDVKELSRKLERERDAYEDKLILYKDALIQISKLSHDDCPDFGLDSIQTLTHNILND